ncbi:MAG: hypothetical protein JJ863_21265 [Deltaproteobacteria bacterium]|nr:hypothetical protein [Deltaproteobacteria bacterium]
MSSTASLLLPSFDERAAMLGALVRVATRKHWATWWTPAPAGWRTVCLELPSGRVGFDLPADVFERWMPHGLEERAEGAPAGDLLTIATADWEK